MTVYRHTGASYTGVEVQLKLNATAKPAFPVLQWKAKSLPRVFATCQRPVGSGINCRTRLGINVRGATPGVYGT